MTDKPNDGGPAFPGGSHINGEYDLVSDGMSLRDWFAGQALAGWMADPNSIPSAHDNAKAISESVYKMADAMLAERGKSNA